MGLMDILNGMANGPRGRAEPGKGGMSPMTMAMLALLAYKAYQKMNAGQSQPAPANKLPPGGTMAGAGGGLGGGLGDMLGGLLGGGARGSAAGGNIGDVLGGLLGGGARSGSSGNSLPGGLAGGLGGLLAGGAAGSILSGGLGELLNQLQQSGHQDAAKSWVGTGQNQPISPNDLERALGSDTVKSLAEQAGLSQIELLDGLAQNLPRFVDQLTPDGRLPTEQEMQRLL